MVDYETILNELGVITQPQWIQLVLLSLPAVFSAMHMAAMMFLGFNQRHKCTMPIQAQIIQECNVTWDNQLTKKYIPWNDETQSLDSCSRYKFTTTNCTFWTSNFSNSADNSNGTEQCNSWTYDTSEFTSTVVGDFDLVCANKQRARLSQAIFMFGVVVGTSAWGQLSDRCGRKISILLPMVIGVGVGIATAYAQSFAEFTIFRFFIGLTIFPAFSNSFVAASETLKQEHKVWTGQAFQAVFAAGICILPGIAYFVREWRTFQLCISVPGAMIILLLWYIFESPRWLISAKRYIKANTIIKSFIKSKKNLQSVEAQKLQTLSKMQREGKSLLAPTADDCDEKQPISTNDKTDNVFQILKLPNMRRKSLILYYEWLVVSALYYGLTLNSVALGGNHFINAFLSAIVEIPASLIAVPMIQKWGRRPTLALTLIVTGVTCMCMMFVPKELVWLNVTLSTLGKFAVSAAFGDVYIYTADIYPTPVRNVGLGVCSSWARIGGMLAPFIAMLDTIGFAVPYVAFGLMAVIGGFLGLLLPETIGKKIPETLEEAEEFGKNYEGVLAFLCRRKEPGAERIIDREETKA